MKTISRVVVGVILASVVAIGDTTDKGQVTCELGASEIATDYRAFVYLNKKGADRELIHVDAIVKSPAAVGSPIKVLLGYLVIDDSKVAVLLIEKEAVVTGAKLVVVEKAGSKWRIVESRSLFVGRNPYIPAMVVPRESKSPFTIRQTSESELVVEYVIGEGKKITEKVPLQKKS